MRTDQTDNAICKTCKLPFSPVTAEDKTLTDRYMKPHGQSSCQHSFLNLYTLSEKYGSCICEKNGFLLTLRSGLNTDGKRVYLAPMGSGNLKDAYDLLRSDAAAYGCRAVFQTITKDQVDFLKEQYPGVFEYTELRDDAEYLYCTERLIKMQGKRFLNKRNEINQILRTYAGRMEVRLLTKDSLNDVWEYEKKWFGESAATHDEAALKREMNAIRIQLEHFDLLEVRGIGIYIDGEMVAFNYGVPLNDHCFDGVIAKAERRIPHLYKLLFWETSRRCAAEYTYFNWEEDVGVAGLRNMKMQYAPDALLRKYRAEERTVPSAEPESREIPAESAIASADGEELLPEMPSEKYGR